MRYFLLCLVVFTAISVVVDLVVFHYLPPSTSPVIVDNVGFATGFLMAWIVKDNHKHGR